MSETTAWLVLFQRILEIVQPSRFCMYLDKNAWTKFWIGFSVLKFELAFASFLGICRIISWLVRFPSISVSCKWIPCKCLHIPALSWWLCYSFPKILLFFGLIYAITFKLDFAFCCLFEFNRPAIVMHSVNFGYLVYNVYKWCVCKFDE